MRFARTIALCGLATLLGTATASAAHPQERKGFWIGLGFGYGWANPSCEGCLDVEGDGASTFTLRLGWALNQKVLLGGEFDLWWNEREEDSLVLYNPMLTVHFYPSEASGFFLKGGIGGSYGEREAFIDNNTRVTTELGSGFGFLAGAGYDIRVGRKISITPALSYWAGRSMDVEFDNTVRDWKHDVVDITVAVTFH
jgi:hypothetical protein